MSRRALAVAILLLATACTRTGGDQTSPDPEPTQTITGEEPALSPTSPPSVEPTHSFRCAQDAEKGRHPALRDPSLASETAPASYAVLLETTKGDIVIDVHRSWAPIGADRFFNLVKIGYYEDIAFFRVISGFMAQVGINGEGEVNSAWRTASISDDQGNESNTRGAVTFATSGPNSRTTQFFINYSDNSRLDSMGFTPIGRVRDMQVVDSLYSGYGEGAPGGRGPNQGRLQSEGNTYLRAEFPELDFITNACIIE